VNQVADFSTASTTTTIASGATLAFDSVINGSGALVSNGTLSFGIDGRLIQDGDVTLNEGSTIEFLMRTAILLYRPLQRVLILPALMEIHLHLQRLLVQCLRHH